jgi:hypothetical protein
MFIYSRLSIFATAMPVEKQHDKGLLPAIVLILLRFTGAYFQQLSC